MVASTTSSIDPQTAGTYLLSLAAGTYDLDTTPSPSGGKATQTDPGIAVTAGLTTAQNIDYQAGGC